jgi:hypothetical protein
MTTEEPLISPNNLHTRLAEIESPRSPFISALITQAEGSPVFGARLIDPSGRRTGFLNSILERAGELSSGAALRLDRADDNATLGQMLIASRPARGNWFIELTAWQNGTIDISILMPGQGASYRHAVFTGVQIVQGREYRIRVQPGSTTELVLEELIEGAYRAMSAVAQINSISEPPARLVGALQVSEEVMTSGDKYGRLVALLFSKPMQKSSSESASRYKVSGGERKGTDPPSIIGKPINVRSASLQLGGRFVFLGLDAPIGPYIRRGVTISGINDSRGIPLSASSLNSVITTTVSREGNPPGAYLTGRVVLADGSPVASAPVVYWTQNCRSGERPAAITIQSTDADGRYAIDYVRNGDCGGVVVTATNPANGSQKRLNTPVAYDGQHMVLDMVFLARGSVRGRVMTGSVPAPFAFVKIVPHLDASIIPIVQTDSLGHYSIDDIPVGHLTVSAIGSGTLSTSTGLASGSIDGPGQTAIVDVSLQNISGTVRGQVINADFTPSAGSLVIAKAELTGFPSSDPHGIPVGFAFTGRDGSFALDRLPLTEINLEVKDYVTDLLVHRTAQLSQTTQEINAVIITLPGFGSISGKVADENGVFIPFAKVRGGGREVETDALGNYELIRLRAGIHIIAATDKNSGARGEVAASVAINQITSNANIVITRPGAVTGQVFALNASGQSAPVSNATVTHDGLTLTTTDSQGRYKIGNIRANTPFTLRFIHPNNRLAVNIDTFVAPGEIITRNATFKSASLRGRIFQPDNSTGTVAELTAFVHMPSLEPGGEFGLMAIKEISTQSAADGTYSIGLLNTGTYRVRASNAFFATRVSKGGTLTQGEDEVCNITLVSNLAGRIKGQVFLPDGLTPAGSNVNVTLGGSLADVTVRTDLNGNFEFPEVFAEGSYALTANDPASGLTNRITISVRQNEDAIISIKLLGRGALRVRVVDGAGNLVTGGNISIAGTAYPRDQRFAEFTAQSDGVIEFNNLSEGDYAISATQNGLSGRTSVTVSNGSIIETTIHLQASGMIEGRVLMPDSVTAVELADVFLSVNNRRIGITVTSDEEGQKGRFNFAMVPAGNFTLEAFDNQTGRTGRATGTIMSHGDVFQVDIKLIAVGAVTGIVNHNGQPVDHALVKINSSGGIRLQTTTSADGRYRFTAIPVGSVSISVTDGPGGLTGHATGQITGTSEPLADTVIDVMLQPSLTVTGIVFKHGGNEPAAGARVILRAGSRMIETVSDQRGEYRIEFVPTGELRVKAEAPTGLDRGESPPVIATQAGSIQVINVTLAGTGNIAGLALDNNGAPLSSGTVTYTNVEFGSEIVLVGHVQSDGTYQINGAPTGKFSVRLTVAGRAGAGVASNTITANQTIELPVRMEDAGTVKGIVKKSDGITPSASTDVRLTLVQSAKVINLLGHTNSHGIFIFENVPLGTVSINISDPQTEDTASASGLSLNENGQILDAGTLVLNNDRTPPVIDPLPIDQSVQGTRRPAISATYRDDSSGIDISSISLSLDGVNVTVAATVTASGLTFQPSNLLASGSHNISIELADNAGNVTSRTANFTIDNTPPSITNFRIGGTTATNGMTVTSSLRPIFEAAYTDDSDIDTGQTRLLFGATDSTLIEVSAIVTATSLTFQPDSNLTEGIYITELIVVDSLGNSTTTGRIELRLDADAPLITTVTPASGNQHGGTRVTLTGERLLNTNGTSPLIHLGGRAVSVTSVTAGDTDSVVFITPAGTPGPTNISVSTDKGTGTLLNGFTYESDPRTPFVAEPDTRMLWHLDEAGNGQLQILDSGPLSIDGRSSSSSIAADGRFAGGRSRLLAQAGADLGALSFGSSSFTVECWIKTGPVSLRTILIGKTSGFGSSEEYALELQPSGVLTGKVINNGNALWQVNMEATVFDVDDNLWHSVAMVLDREAGKLRLYVDGLERASRDEPNGFGAVRNLNLPVFAGFTPTSFFNGILDEVRISSSAHSPEKIREDYFGLDGPLVVKPSPAVIQQGTASATIDLSGKGLAGISVSSNHPGITAIAVWSTATAALLNVNVSDTTPLGSSRLTITDPNGHTTNFELTIVDQRPFENSPDGNETRLLWHLDEPGNGTVTIIGSGDAVPSIIGGRAGSNSQAAQGRFGGGRTMARASSSASAPFAFGASSFTFEFWMKTRPLERSYALAGKETVNGQNSDFTIVANEIGGLRADLINASAALWFAEIPGTLLSVFDNQWHYVSVVVERNPDPATDRLKIYVDGELRASTASPDGFGSIRDSGNEFQIGSFNGDSAGIGPAGFPGVIDEVRVLNFARTAEQIRATWLGTNNSSGLNLRIPPRLIQRHDAASLKGGRK